MKKIFTIISLAVFSLWGYSQTHLSEDFSGNQMPPADWTLDGYSNQWSVSGTTNAGGSAPEGKFTYTNGNSITRLVSPVVDLSGYTNVTLKFSFFYDFYGNPAPALGVATKSNGGDWNTAWSTTPTGNVGPSTQFVEIATDDVGAEDFQFCIYLQGNFYNLDFVFFDDIRLYTPYNFDAELSSINTYQFLEEPAEIIGTLTNSGTELINNLNISWQIDDGEITNTDLTNLSIPTNSPFDFTCDGILDLPVGGYQLKIWVNSVNGNIDEYPLNDTLVKNISFISHKTEKAALLEEFTSSTCAPCAGFNTSFVPWSETHEEEIVLVKYQMSWPAPGDPYFTEEGGVRRLFYGVGGVPSLIGNGSYIATSTAGAQALLDQVEDEPGLLSLVGTHSIDGTNIEVTANILPYANFSDVVVHIVVFEYVTTENTGNNGETEFHHVMMKMLPDANGTAVNLIDREPITITESFDMASTFVEEMDDLGVAIIVQASDATVYQSVYSLEDEVYATESGLIDVELDGESFDEFDPEVYEYSINLPSNTVETPSLIGIPVDENSIVIEVPAFELPGTTVIDVFGQDVYSHQRYEFEFTLGVGVQSAENNNISMYPNPANNYIFIKNIPEGSNVLVTDITGRVILNMNDSNLSTDQYKLNTSHLETGVYHLQVISGNHNYTKKFTVSR